MGPEPLGVNAGFTKEAFPAGTHLCHLFNDEEERDEALIAFLLAGDRAGERAVCVLPEAQAPATLAARLGRRGLSLEALQAEHTLALLGAREYYFKEGSFDPDRSIALLNQMREASLQAGRAARMMGVVCPDVGRIEEGRPLVAYERAVGRFVREQRNRVVCQYDAAAFDGATLMDVLRVHPAMLHKGQVIHNPFFLDAEADSEAHALGQLLLIESLLPHLPSRLSMLRFAVRGLEGLPGVRKAWFQDGASGPDRPDGHAFEVRCSGRVHAVIHLAVEDEARFSPYGPYVKNLMFMFGVVLNELVARDEGERTRVRLEALVAARTEALVASEGRARDMLRTALDGVWLVDAQDRILEVNEAACTMLGYSHGELLGMRVDALEPEGAKAHLACLRQLGSRLFEARHRRKDGTTFPVEVSGTFHPDRGQAVVFIRDITTRRQAEELLLQDFERQCALARQVAEARQLESLGRLAGGVAHDMNNVLGAILALASSHLEACPERSPFHGDLDLIAKAAMRGGHMVKDLLAFARQTPLAVAEVDLNAVVQEVVRLLERTTLARIRLVFDLEPGLRPMRGDAHALANAVMNLCLNAVDAMTRGGTLILTTRNVRDGAIELQVQDTGSGMPPDVQRRALEPFFTTKEVGRGTGLGLAMVHGTVKAHHGELTLQSEPGTGTRVTLAFPACEPAAPTPGPPPAPRRPVAEATRQVLLVDDDPLVRSATQALLDRLGHHTRAAAGGEEALAHLEQGTQPDLVILDLNMPGLSGAETLARLRVLAPKLPVILATGSPDQAAQDLIAQYPPITLLPKPYTLSDLRQQLAAADPPNLQGPWPAHGAGHGP